MRRYLIYTAPILMFILAAGKSFASLVWVSIDGGEEPARPAVVVLESGETKTTLRFDIPGFWVREVIEGGESYHEIRLPGYGTTMDVGRPALPVLSVLVAIPSEAGVHVGITDYTETKLAGYLVHPYQRPLREPEQRSTFDIDRALYREDAFYPSEEAAVGAPAIWRDIRVVKLTVNPFHYNPASGELAVRSRVTVRLHYAGRDGRNLKMPSAFPIYDDYEEAYRRSIINYGALGSMPGHEPPPMVQEPIGYDYLFIVADGFEDEIAPLVDYKESIGFATKVTLASKIPDAGPSGDPVEEIKDYIRGEYEAANIRYLLLVGDENIIPAYTGYGFFSDYYYALLDGTDDFADIGIGRFSATSSVEVLNMVAKSITYEANPPPGDWLEKALLIAHWELAPLKYQECKEQVRTAVETQSGGYGILWPIFSRLYGSSGENGGNWAMNMNIISHINEGRRVVNYRGHGSEFSWPFWNLFFEYFTAADIAQLSNGDMTPVVFAIACLTNNLLCEGECLGESFTRADDGAVAYLGATGLSWTEANHTYDKQLFSLAFDEGVSRIADASNEAAVRIITQYDSIGIENARMYLWLGEPSLRILEGSDPEAPLLCSPVDGSRMVPTSSVELAWYAVPEASRYLVHLDETPHFASSREFVVSSCGGDTCFVIIPGPLDEGTWYWRVRVDVDEWPWSESRSFEVKETITPSCPILFSRTDAGFKEEGPLLSACARSGYADVVVDNYHVRGAISTPSGTIVFQLREMEDEITFLEGLELITVDHESSTSVGCTGEGDIFVYDHQVLPLSARDGGGTDVLAAIAAHDGVRFDASGQGELVLTLPATGKDIDLLLDTVYRERCPIIANEKYEPSASSGGRVTVDVFDGSERTMPMDASARSISTGGPFMLDGSGGSGEMIGGLFKLDGAGAGGGPIRVRLSWDEAFSTDVISCFARSREEPIVNRYAVSRYRLTSARKEPGGTMSALGSHDGTNGGGVIGGMSDGMSGGGVIGTGSDARPLELHRGDILEFEFDTGGVGARPARGITRDYIIRATGRYHPDYAVYTDLVPARTVLYGNYPNPFNPATSIRFDLHRPSRARLEIFDVAGRRIAILLDEARPAGHHEVAWDGSTAGGGRAASGLYFCRLTTDDAVVSRKILLLR